MLTVMERGSKYFYCCSLTPYQIQLQSSVCAWRLTQGNRCWQFHCYISVQHLMSHAWESHVCAVTMNCDSWGILLLFFPILEWVVTSQENRQGGSMTFYLETEPVFYLMWSSNSKTEQFYCQNMYFSFITRETAFEGCHFSSHWY